MTPIRQPPATGQVVGGVFEIVSLLGVGAGGAVYSAREVDSGQTRAVKLFSHTANTEQTLHEFRVLSRIRHPGCVAVHAFGNDAVVGAYLVMDLVEGASPTDVIPRGQDPNLLRFTQKVLETLAYLHERGVVHGDLKPSNLRCLGGDPTRPVLLDFGLASTRDEARAGGTILYMAPELFRQQPPNARTDLYALGVMLYEISAGRPPYPGATDLQVTRGHLRGDVQPLRRVIRGVSDGYSRLVGRLMAREAGDRPGSAREALAELAELTGVELIEASEDVDPALAVSLPTLVERDDIVEAFRDGLAQASRNEGGALTIVHGPAGSGRTRMVRELDIVARLAGCRVVAWSPSQEGPGHAIAESLRTMLYEQTSEDLSGLVDALHRMERLEERTDATEDADETALDSIAGAGLDVLRAASARAPIALFVDDLASDDPYSARIIHELSQGLATTRLVLVVSCDHADVVPSAELDPERVEVHELQALSSDGIERFVRTALGEVSDPEALRRWLAQESGGNPAVLTELLRWLVEAGLLARRRGRWHLSESLELASGSAAAGVEAIAQRRLELVPPGLRKTLACCAVMGADFDPGIAARAGGRELPGDEDISRLTRMRIVAAAPRSVWRLRFANLAMRRVLLAEVPEEEARALHGAIADEILEQVQDRDADTLAAVGVLRDVARHLLGAGRWQSGVPLARNAAQRARRATAFGEADELYGMALSALESRPDAASARAMILCDRGDLQMDADRAHRATESYRAAAEMLTDEDPYDVRRRLGHALVVTGAYDEAVERLQKVVNDARMSNKSRVLAAHDIGWAHMLRSDWASAMRAAELAESLARRLGQPALEARIRSLRGNVLWQKGEWEPSLVENEAAYEIYERIRDHRGAARALMAMGTAHRHLSQYGEATRCYALALERFERLQDLRGVGKCQNNLAVVHYYQGDWMSATRRWEEFLQILERTGERIERVSLLNNLGSLYRERGLFERAEDLLRQGLELARELGARRLEAMLLGNLGDTVTRAGRYHSAQELLQRTIELSDEIDAPDEGVEARRRMLELEAMRDPGSLSTEQLQSVLDEAIEHKLKLEEANVRRLWSVHLRHAGRLNEARAHLRAAASALDGAGAVLEERRLQREIAILSAERGDREGAITRLGANAKSFDSLDASWDAQLSRDAIRRLRGVASGAAEPHHLDTIASFCEHLGAFEDPREFLSNALHQIVDLVAADRGLICLFDEADRPSLKVVHRRSAGDTSPQDRLFSRTITRDAYRSDSPIFIAAATEDKRYKDARSVAIMDSRSVLAAPIVGPQRRRGAIYLDTAQARDDSLRRAVPMVAALGSVLGASLEHAELLETERARNETMAMLAHELRGPLAGIYAHLELVREQHAALPEELQEYLDVASSELLRLNRMVDNLSDVARLEHHSSANTVVSLDLHELIATVVATLSSLSHSKHQQISLELDDDLPLALGSRDRIIQVLTNLLNNAIKFTPDGRPIRIRASVVEREAVDASLGPDVPVAEFLTPVQAHVSDLGSIQVSVEDSGPGVPDEVSGTIFSKFRQLGDKSARKRGLGLGLAIARHIVERHGGRIWCENLPEGGAAFRFTLPSLQE